MSRIHRRYRAIILLPFFFILTGCWLFMWDVIEPYYYNIQYKNETSTPIILKLVPHLDISDGILILPDSIYEDYGFGANTNEDIIIDGLFGTDDNRFWNEISIYWDDTLELTWIGPCRDMPDSIHHFFNPNSWEIITNNENDNPTGYVRFSILESDINKNTDD